MQSAGLARQESGELRAPRALCPAERKLQRWGHCSVAHKSMHRSSFLCFHISEPDDQALKSDSSTKMTERAQVRELLRVWFVAVVRPWSLTTLSDSNVSQLFPQHFTSCLLQERLKFYSCHILKRTRTLFQRPSSTSAPPQKFPKQFSETHFSLTQNFSCSGVSPFVGNARRVFVVREKPGGEIKPYIRGAALLNCQPVILNSDR